MSAQQRERVWNQRFQESMGGRSGDILAQQCGLTSMVCSYALLRSKGYRVTPLSLRTLPLVSGVFCAGLLGTAYGKSYSKVVLGNSSQKRYLMNNKNAILAGTTPMDQ